MKRVERDGQTSLTTLTTTSVMRGQQVMAEKQSNSSRRSYQALAGRTFGKLFVVEESTCVYINRNKMRRWICRCSCGKQIVADHCRLLRGEKKSCGCLQKKHGGCRLPEYRIWCHAIRRCHDPRDAAFPRYGGRGIVVCQRWRTNFANFLADLGSRPSTKHTLDRIDNDGPYSPENCRWATQKQQARNTRRNIVLTFQGKTQCLSAWAEEIGIRVGTLWNRIKVGYSVEEALMRPLRRQSTSRDGL